MSVSTSLASSSANFTFVHLKVPSFSPPPPLRFCLFSPPPPPFFCFSSVALFPTAVSYTLPFSPSSIVLLSPPFFLVRSLFQYFLMRSLTLLSANALLISKEPYRPLIWPFIRTSLYKWCHPCSNSSLSPRLRITDRPKTWLIEGLLTDKQNQLQTDLTLNGSPHNQSIPPLPPSPLPFPSPWKRTKNNREKPRKTKQIAKNTKSKSQPSQKQKVTKFGVFLSDPTKYINNDFEMIAQITQID